MRATLAGLCLALLAASLPVQAAPGPAWLAQAVGRFAGVVRNAGRLECHRTVFALQDGQLVGHYWIDGADPFEGSLTGFVPAAEAGAGTFTWTDRDGAGVEFVQFADDYASFRGAWGRAAPDLGNPVWGTRGIVAGCDPAVS